MKILKDVLIQAGQIDKYFDGRTPVTLWRAKKRACQEMCLSLLKSRYTSQVAFLVLPISESKKEKMVVDGST